MKLKLYAAAGGTVALIAGMLWFAATRGPLAPGVVEMAAATEAELASSVFGIGTVEARHSYAIGPTQAGRVSRVHVDHGDAVKAGKVLAEIDPVDLIERLKSAESAAERARHAVQVAEAQEREAHSRRAIASANAVRYHDLVQKNFVSREAAEIRVSEASAAQAGQEAAQAALLAARKDVERALQDRAALARQLGNLRLTSPVDGIVIARDAEPGTTVVAGQAVVRIIDPGSLWVRARIDQSRASGLAPGLSADIVLRSNPGNPIPGEVARVEIQSDAVAEERIVAVAFTAPPPLSVGELAEVTIHRGKGSRGVVVPSAAVKRVNGRSGVWQMVDGRTRFRPVRTGVQTLDGLTEVTDGLAAGESVIVYSSVQLREGVRVRIGRVS
jgi:HlyD family secretion protein